MLKKLQGIFKNIQKGYGAFIESSTFAAQKIFIYNKLIFHESNCSRGGSSRCYLRR